MNYVPLKEAAKKHNVDEQVLTQLISAGMINAKKEAGGILVAVDKNDNSAGGLQTKEEIIAAKYGDSGVAFSIEHSTPKQRYKWLRSKCMKMK